MAGRGRPFVAGRAGARAGGGGGIFQTRDVSAAAGEGRGADAALRSPLPAPLGGPCAAGLPAGRGAGVRARLRGRFRRGPRPNEAVSLSGWRRVPEAAGRSRASPSVPAPLLGASVATDSRPGEQRSLCDPPMVFWEESRSCPLKRNIVDVFTLA